MSESSSGAVSERNTRRWWIARGIGAVALLAYYVKILTVRFADAFHEFSIDGDQIQGAWQYWRYHVKGALPPGQLLTDYAFSYHSPPFHWAWAALLSTFVPPITTATITHLTTWSLLLVGVVYVVGKHSEWLLGIAAGFIVARNPEMSWIFGAGIARSWGPPLTIWFLAAFLARKHVACLVILVLAAGLYPVVSMGCGIAYGAYCVIAGPTMVERRRRIAGMFVAGLCIIGLGEGQNLRAPEWWGPLISMEQASKMPAWHSHGRFHELPMPGWTNSFLAHVGTTYREYGTIIAPEAAKHFVEHHDRIVLLLVPSLLSLLAIGVDRWRRFRDASTVPVPEDMRVRWQFFAVWGGAMCGYIISRVFAYQFFIPERQLGYIVPFLIQSGFPLLVWCGVRVVVGNRRALAVAITAAVTVLPTFVLRGDGLEPHAYYKDHGNSAKLFKFMRTLPLDANIAADNYIADVMGSFTYHSPWANRTMTHPFRLGLYAEQERRLVEQSRALYATSFDALAAFAAREHIDYFVYNIDKLNAPETQMYEPAKTKIDAIFKASKGHMVLISPPPEAVIFAWQHYRVLDMHKLAAWVTSQKTAIPFGPQPEPAHEE